MAISLMEAYIIEALKAHPYSYDEVAAYLQAGNTDVFKRDYPFDFELIQNLFDKDEHTFHEAFTKRYQVKYVTMNGLKSLLRLKFGLVETDYTELANGVTELVADENTEQEVRYMVSSNWTITRHGAHISILA